MSLHDQQPTASAPRCLSPDTHHASLDTPLPDTVFLTGASGFIGSHLAERLAADGHTVRALVRRDARHLNRAPTDLAARIARVSCDLADPTSLAEALHGVTAVVHVAGLTRAPGASLDAETAFEAANVTATTHLLDAVLTHAPDVRRVVLTSSLAAVGRGNGSAVADEATPLAPISRYGASKARMEAAIAPYRDRLPLAVVRPPAVYGPREADILTFFQTAARGLVPVVGDPTAPALTLVHVRDLVEGYVRAMTHPAAVGQTYFLGTAAPVSWGAVRDATAAALGRRVVTVRVPKALIVPIGTAVEALGRLAGQYPPLNREKALELRDAVIACDSSKAMREIGYAPSVDLAEGIAETIAWYRAEGWL